MRSKLLRDAREAKGLTQEKTAELLGVSFATYNSTECKRTKPSVSLAQKIGKLLDIDWYKIYEEE